MHGMRINRAVGLGVAIVVLKLLMFGVVVGMESFLVTAFQTGELMLFELQQTGFDFSPPGL